MAFGLSFGKKKESAAYNKLLSQTEVGTESQTSNKAGTTTGTQSTSQQGQTSTSQTQSQAQQGATNTSGSQVGTQQQVTQNFSDRTLGGLEDTVGALFGNSSLTSIRPTSDFNVKDFIANGLEAARANAQQQLETGSNQLYDSIGGRQNSMAQLLQDRLFNDTNASLAGTEADLTAKGEEIQRQNTLTGVQVANNGQDFLVNLLNALKGGVSGTTGTSQTATSEAGTSSQTGTGTTTGQESVSQTGQTSSVESVVEAIAQLLNSNKQTNGTESGTSKGKVSGFGASLSG